MKVFQKTLLSCLILILATYTQVEQTAFAGGQSSEPDTKVGSAGHQAKRKRKLAFKITSVGDTITKDGVMLSFKSLEASDGVKLLEIYKEFDSALLAKKQFDGEIASAKQILKQGKKRDKTGQIVGERVQAIVYSGETGRTSSAVLWTHGRNYHMIISNYSSDILELEKTFTY